MKSKTMDVREMNTRDMLQTLTQGRPYIFVIMSYKEEKKRLYDSISKIARERFNVACIRADEVTSSGYDLLAKIHHLISRAELVIAEISEWSPNVFYEIGYAVGVQKPPLLLIAKGKKIPTDLKGLEVIEYKDIIGGIDDFERDLFDHLRFRMNSELAVLRDMLEAPAPEPSYIVTSPKYPGTHTRIKGQVYDTRTFGDHLGILGLTSAFGSMWGEGKGIELISAQHSPPDLLTRDINLYLIGSRKVNTPAGEMLERIQQDREPKWSFGPSPECKTGEIDWPVALYKNMKGKRDHVRGEVEELGSEKEMVWVSDYGIVMRGPHPEHPERLVLIMAGAHSLGTGAACLAATRSAIIQKVRSKLPQGALEDKHCTFWVLVKGTVNRNDFLLDEDGVIVEDAGVY